MLRWAVVLGAIGFWLAPETVGAAPAKLGARGAARCAGQQCRPSARPRRVYRYYRRFSNPKVVRDRQTGAAPAPQVGP